MTIDLSGLDSKLSSSFIQVYLDQNGAFYRLCNAIPWEKLYSQILPDLKNTAKGFWQTGRKLNVRKHLGAYLLQSITNKTDREIGEDLKYNGMYQAFCGATTIENWIPPHWTKIEEFRNRISRDNQHAIGEIVLKLAHENGFCDPTWADIDSTVQKPNMSYPSDARLMVKLTEKASKAVKKLKEAGLQFTKVDIEPVRNKAKEYFFATKNHLQDSKQKILKELHSLVVEEIVPFTEKAMQITAEKFKELPTRVQKLTDLVCYTGVELLQHIDSWLKTGIVAKDKIMSFVFHRVKCIRKGKVGKPNEFGSVYHLARLGGNFLMILKPLACVEEDRNVIPRVVYQHRKIFGKGVLNSCGSDRGYYSSRNINSLKRAQVSEIGIQSPGKVLYRDDSVTSKREEILFNRRAGIEPLIGHVKHGGLGRSRAKSDQTTEMSAYRSVTGFNLRQFMRADMAALHGVIN